MLPNKGKGTEPRIGGCVLAGGHATRAGGREKELFVIKEQTFLENILNIYCDLDECVISYNKQKNLDRYLEHFNRIREEQKLSRIRVISDSLEFLDKGPIGGIYSVLSNVSCDGMIFCPCDVPFFNRQAVEILLKEFKDDRPVIFKSQNRIQSLCGIYPAKVLPVIRECIQNGEYKIRCVLDKLPTKYLEAETYGLDARTFCNVNTIEELEKLQRESNIFYPEKS